MQILTGLFLSIHYTCDSSLAFSSLSHIYRDVWGGWLLRSMHANGASFFFMAVYLHIGRGVYYGGYLALSVWIVGMVILVLLMASAFLGYILPWGQIRFWGATVITNLFGALPYVGTRLVTWIWGGFRIDNPTLTRFYSLHFLTPFLLRFLVLLHLRYLHIRGSSNPLGVGSRVDSLPFHWYYSIKDAFGFRILMSVFVVVVFFYPTIFLEADNFIPSNPMVTPPHITPEWYFLFAYTILRSVPSKLGGVFALAASILILSSFPFTHFCLSKSLTTYGPVKGVFWSQVVVFCLLTLAGFWPVSDPFLFVSRCFAGYYFSFYVLFPLSRVAWDKLLD